MTKNSLLRSLLTLDNPFCTTEEALTWICERNKEVSVSVEEIPFGDMKDWSFRSASGNLEHSSGRFFSISGLDVYADDGHSRHWTQPIIDQPEVGYLGMICREIDGVLYFLVQAKIEPGNVNCVQLSPTLQATRSNYMRVHGGRSPAFLENFKNVDSNQIILDQLQSEQGARFFRKRNRNIIINDQDCDTEDPDFRWLTLGQIRALMQYDNLVNMDTRTVLSGLSFRGGMEMLGNGGTSEFGMALLKSEDCLTGINSIDDILHRVSSLKARYELRAEKISLRSVTDWIVSDMEIAREDRRYFRVIGVNVAIENREVSTWCQPLVQPMQEGLCALFLKEINGILHLLLQEKVECGNLDVVEFAPTIQCLTGNYRNPIGYVPLYLQEFLSGRCVQRIVFDTLQSEEGGRFYHEQNRNVALLVNEVVPVEQPENFVWMTLGQAKEFLKYNNYLNIQVRSLISALEYI